MRFGILSLAIVAIASLTDAHADQRVALVIGNSAYQHVAKLPNPVNDAQAVAALFKRAGFDVVESRLDLDAANLKRAMRDFTDMARDADVAVVYYAGHGIEVDGNNYLIPVDAVLERDVDVDDETVSVDRVMRALDPVKRLRLVILDACRDNPFTRTMKRTMTSRAIGRGLAKMEPLTSDTLIAFAAKAGSTAMDGDGKNSPFTRALVKHLATPDLDLRMAFGRVRDDVMKATSNRQEPFVYGSLGGSVVSLLRSPDLKAAAPADPTFTNLADMRRDYEFFERAGTKEAWETFLELYPSGPYAVLARGHIARLSAAEKMESGATYQTAGVQAKSGSEKLADPASAPIQVATGTTDVAISRPAAPPAPGEITRLLQIELRRVGRLTGSTDGSWNTDSRRALEIVQQIFRLATRRKGRQYRRARCREAEAVPRLYARMRARLPGRGRAVRQDRMSIRLRARRRWGLRSGAGTRSEAQIDRRAGETPRRTPAAQAGRCRGWQRQPVLRPQRLSGVDGSLLGARQPSWRLAPRFPSMPIIADA